MTSSSKAANRCAVIFLLILTASASTSDRKVHGAKRVRRSDDVTLMSMYAVVQQQASAIQTLQAKVTSSENKVTAMENNVKALQTKLDVASSAVAFSARFSDDQDNFPDGVALRTHQTLVFNEAVTNVGNAYSPSTGIFTAPVAGTYAFFLSAMSSDNHPAIYLAIMKNGVTLDHVYAQGQTDAEDQGSSLVSAHLVKGDRVSVRQMSGNAVRASWYTIFTGYLLQAQ